MPQLTPRQISFEAIYNFRDLGGYRTLQGNSVIWGKLFRSGELHNMTGADFQKLKIGIGLKSVLDLRSYLEIAEHGVGLVAGSGFRYFNISFISDGGDREANIRRYQKLANMGEFYVTLSRQKEFSRRLVEALEIIADPQNHPLVFHCSAGKDRTGLLAALVLNILGIADNDIADDYFLTASHPKQPYNRTGNETREAAEEHGLPDYFWELRPELILQYLTALREEYGSGEKYILAQGADSSLVRSLKKSLVK